ncbi:hypothetical protein [Burkholderia aenigmatica]|uniref:hypothetical protein n=1 Tax=Burkholderia aenigmatica TaxID=2015348 RepID=UPI00264E4E31|nr:hypothetical protein [Burkholderia aenigmatica]MDN7880975.1 hypothetical protein [Burkholderia aenigmatica]
MKSKSNRALAREARERGEDRFMAVCQYHGEQSHYVSSAGCTVCLARKGAAKTLRRQQDPEVRAAHNAYVRVQMARLRKADPGPTREGVAAQDWRKATGGNMSGWYTLERTALRRMYSSLPEGFEVDHAIPKIAEGSDGKRVACGLHCFSNLIPTPRRVNRWKHCQFSPDTNRDQRPANRFPGGAFDPEPTAHEWSLIRQNAEMGTPEAESLRTLRESLDAKACEHEQHVTALLACIGA